MGGGGSDRYEERSYKYVPSGRIVFKGTQLNLSSNGSHSQQIAARHWVFI
jgi:hypothetical protein